MLLYIKPNTPTSLLSDRSLLTSHLSTALKRTRYTRTCIYRSIFILYQTFYITCYPSRVICQPHPHNNKNINSHLRSFYFTKPSAETEISVQTIRYTRCSQTMSLTWAIRKCWKHLHHRLFHFQNKEQQVRIVLISYKYICTYLKRNENFFHKKYNISRRKPSWIRIVVFEHTLNMTSVRAATETTVLSLEAFILR